MKTFYYDNEENVFGIKDDEKFKILKFNVFKCSIVGNKATIYCEEGMISYNLLPDGSITTETMN